MKKKGEFHGKIVNLILVVIILSISIYFIFDVLWTQEDINWEVCRTSIIARNSVPNYALISDVKDLVPLKCGMGVIVIDYKNIKKAEEEIAYALAQCKYLYEGDGDEKYILYPPKFFNDKAYCSPCVRIHFDDDVRDFYKWEKPNEFTDKDMYVLRYLNETGFKDGESFQEYLWGDKNVVRPEGFRMPKGFGDNDWGFKPYINPSFDLVIGNYFLSDSRINLNPLAVIFSDVKVFEDVGIYSAVFYYQPENETVKCDWEGALR